MKQRRTNIHAHEVPFWEASFLGVLVSQGVLVALAKAEGVSFDEAAARFADQATHQRRQRVEANPEPTVYEVEAAPHGEAPAEGLDPELARAMAAEAYEPDPYHLAGE